MAKNAVSMIAASLTLFLAGATWSQEPSATGDDANAAASLSHQRAYPQYTIDLMTALIKSKADLNGYLDRTPIAASPLRFFSPTAREAFYPA
jgi:hypothetical protein